MEETFKEIVQDDNADDGVDFAILMAPRMKSSTFSVDITNVDGSPISARLASLCSLFHEFRLAHIDCKLTLYVFEDVMMTVNHVIRSELLRGDFNITVSRFDSFDSKETLIKYICHNASLEEYIDRGNYSEDSSMRWQLVFDVARIETVPYVQNQNLESDEE